MICSICSRPSIPFDKGIILGKYSAQYYRCSQCGFIQTEDPYWLEEAYASPINLSDIGMVGRNIAFARITRAVIGMFLGRNGKYLDYGGGYGLFVRLMRDAGLDFYHYDKHCANIFARGFEVEVPPQPPYELVTAIEVFEHLAQPLEEIGRMLQFSRNLLFSTSLVPAHNPKLADWWYFGVEHGQHVALYSFESLYQIAQHFKLYLNSDGRHLHLLTEKRLSNSAFKLISSGRVAALVARMTKKPSLLAQDYYRITGKHLV